MDGQEGRRSIRPIKLSPKAKTLGVIAIHRDEIITPSGERVSGDNLESIIATSSSSVVVTAGIHHVFARLDAAFAERPDWQFRASVQEMEEDPRISTTLSFFGFKRTHNEGSRRGRLFYPIAIDTFTRDLSLFDGRDDLDRMRAFGIALRDVCGEMGIAVRASAAGVAAQLLRHPRFYPQRRRRVPTFINDVARPHLPGNHYSLFDGAQENVEAATYIDQKAAHHYAAATTPLPSSDTLYARGFTRTEGEGRPWLYPTDAAYPSVIAQHGLLRIVLRVPRLRGSHFRFVPPVLRDGPRTKECWVWTNELEWLERWGAEVRYVIAAYTSPDVDRGLPRYAQWAQDQPAWLKQTLLSAYGVLATRSRRSRFVHAKGKGQRDKLPLGPQLIDCVAGPIQSTTLATTNVIQRGLIESSVRVLSLQLAWELEQRGGEVISIYGDGVFIRAAKGEQLPLPMPWREKREVHNLTFEGAHRLRCDEFTRLPGTPRFLDEYALAQESATLAREYK